MYRQGSENEEFRAYGELGRSVEGGDGTDGVERDML